MKTTGYPYDSYIHFLAYQVHHKLGNLKGLIVNILLIIQSFIRKCLPLFECFFILTFKCQCGIYSMTVTLLVAVIALCASKIINILPLCLR